MIPFIAHSRVWLCLSATLTAVSLLAVIVLGLRLSIDFTGGTLIEIDAPAELAQEAVAAASGQQSVSSQTTSKGTQLFRLVLADAATLSEDVANRLGTDGSIVLLQTVGPSIGQSLQEKAIRALAYAVIAIVLYVGASFRGKQDSVLGYAGVGLTLGIAAALAETTIQSPTVRWAVFAGIVLAFVYFLCVKLRSGSRQSLVMGLAAIVALLHDVLIVLGIFAVLGAVQGVEIDALFITALLTIMGFSVHDTIVVFDRTRENLRRKGSKAGTADLPEIANRSLNQTLTRSINTSVTTLFTLCALLFFGAASITYFTLALMIGIVVGTYSSIFLATPLFVCLSRKH